MFFVVVYLHMFRGMMYGSYRKPRELLWLIGMGIFFVLMMLGIHRLYSALGADVILGRAGDHQHVRRDSGDRPDAVELDSGRLRLSDAALNRFFAYHVVTLPGAGGAGGRPYSGAA